MLFLLIYFIGYIFCFVFLVHSLKKDVKDEHDNKIDDDYFCVVGILSVCSWLFLLIFLIDIIKLIPIKFGKFVEKCINKYE